MHSRVHGLTHLSRRCLRSTRLLQLVQPRIRYLYFPSGSVLSIRNRAYIFCTDVRPVSGGFDPDKLSTWTVYFSIFSFNYIVLSLMRATSLALVLCDIGASRIFYVDVIRSLAEQRVKQICTYSVWTTLQRTNAVSSTVIHTSKW